MCALFSLVLYFLFLLGYRMASECAHQALLKKVVDNKQDSGTDCWPFTKSYTFLDCHIQTIFDILGLSNCREIQVRLDEHCNDYIEL